MYLIAGSSDDLLRFIQILCWIFLPVLGLSALLTIVLHYRKKKKDPGDDKLLTDSAEQIGYTRGDGEYVLFDHSPLIKEYKTRLSYYHARYAALKQDYDRLSPDSPAKELTMNNTPHEPVEWQDAPVDSPAYFQDILTQKNSQIDFLQEQLDSRIRQHHMDEKVTSRLTAELAETAGRALELDDISRNQEMEIRDLRDKLAMLENGYAALKQQNEILNASAADGRDMVALLQEKLELEQAAFQRLSQREAHRLEFLQQVQTDLSRMLSGTDPVNIKLEHSIPAD